MAEAYAIIPAGGSGSRMGLPLPKQFCLLAGIPLLIHTLRAFAASPVDAIIVAAPAEHLAPTRDLLARFAVPKVRAVVAGGRLRQDSVAAGLREVPSSAELIAVHDGARPLVTPALIAACLDEARRSGAAMAAIPVKDTLKAVVGGSVQRTVDRDGLWQAQTPQTARAGLLRQAFAAAAADGFVGTDEASLLERLGIQVSIVEGSERNLKVTRPEDLLVAAALLRNQTEEEKSMNEPFSLRIGHGYDAHCLVAGRDLVLGGVIVDHPKGLLGHSDADVLTHALCDALLGALGEGDIGRHFPDSDERYRGISSLKLLAEVMALAAARGLQLVNADVTVVAQKPKLAPHFPAMRSKLAAVCGVTPEAINLKASTTEKMGFAGREEGIAAHAVALLKGNGELTMENG
ncbi:MAG: 2-C-methyl-D-erythritol 4-phosphate cytidylyltransferase [Desulfobacteraceae bacterium]|nr:2-C-methyl-D-erythritol 4-phosphate cytidylyltransferase [Desulfobacteraceae bacterium]